MLFFSVGGSTRASLCTRLVVGSFQVHFVNVAGHGSVDMDSRALQELKTITLSKEAEVGKPLVHREWGRCSGGT